MFSAVLACAHSVGIGVVCVCVHVCSRGISKCHSVVRF